MWPSSQHRPTRVDTPVDTDALRVGRAAAPARICRQLFARLREAFSGPSQDHGGRYLPLVRIDDR